MADGCLGIMLRESPSRSRMSQNKGQKILTNLNYRIQPHLVAGFGDSGALLSVCNMDRMSNTFCWKLDYDVRQLAYNWEPGVPRTEASAAGAWLGEWLDVEEPEQFRYATDLVLLWQDNLKTEDNFLFVAGTATFAAPVGRGALRAHLHLRRLHAR